MGKYCSYLHWISEVFPEEEDFLPQHLKINSSSDRKERDFISTTLDRNNDSSLSSLKKKNLVYKDLFPSSS